jgi:hypothetical protein
MSQQSRNNPDSEESQTVIANELANAANKTQEVKVCERKMRKDGGFNTACGWGFANLSRYKNTHYVSFIFCPYCGGKIKEVKS